MRPHLKRGRGASVGRVFELRNPLIPGADAVRAGGRQHGGGRQRETALGPAESKTPGMRRNSMRENRETPWLPVEKSRRAGGRTR